MFCAALPLRCYGHNVPRKATELPCVAAHVVLSPAVFPVRPFASPRHSLDRSFSSSPSRGLVQVLSRPRLSLRDDGRRVLARHPVPFPRRLRPRTIAPDYTGDGGQVDVPAFCRKARDGKTGPLKGFPRGSSGQGFFVHPSREGGISPPGEFFGCLPPGTMDQDLSCRIRRPRRTFRRGISPGTRPPGWRPGGVVGRPPRAPPLPWACRRPRRFPGPGRW